MVPASCAVSMQGHCVPNGWWFRRQSEVDAKARDVRLQRALEEVERFKALLQEQRVADKDQKDVSKSEYSRVFAGD